MPIEVSMERLMDNRNRLFELLADARAEGLLDEALGLVESLQDDAAFDDEALLDYEETTDELLRLIGGGRGID